MQRNALEGDVIQHVPLRPYIMPKPGCRAKLRSFAPITPISLLAALTQMIAVFGLLVIARLPAAKAMPLSFVLIRGYQHRCLANPAMPDTVLRARVWPDHLHALARVVE